ncbi:MAG: hypothetical protein R2801_03775 [Chitinophagales bacterium]
MKKYIYLLGTLLALNACKKESRPENEGEFTILTYNIAGLPQGFNDDQFPVKHTPLISPLINDYDIVQVQEDFCYHDKLLQGDKHPYRTVTSGCVPFGSGLNTLSNFPILGINRASWSACTGADCLTPKGFTYSKIKLSNDVVIDCYNLHANAGKSDESFEARKVGFVQLMNFINNNSTGNAIIICSDFNSRYTRPQDTLEIFLNNGFEDTWLELVRNDSVPAFGDDLRNCDIGVNNFDCEKLDKIFYKNNDKIQLTPISISLDDARYYDNEGMPLSDHEPVVVKFKFKLIE